MINKLIKILLKNALLKYPRFLRKIKDLIFQIEPNTTVFLDYPISLKSRYNGNNFHKGLHEILSNNSETYRTILKSFIVNSEKFWQIPIEESQRINPFEPVWINRFLPGMDTIALYGILKTNNPKVFLEVGSGNSTKVAKKSIQDNNLQTQIWSVDPQPRAEINEICDEIFRFPLEEMDTEVFKKLRRGDILFIDNSHRVFMNSDVTAFFLDVLPILEKGVLVQIHDICLPYDYPENWSSRFYSEQYMLAMLLLFGIEKIEIILPNFYISHHPDLSKVLEPIWQNPIMEPVEKHGASFWFKIK